MDSISDSDSEDVGSIPTGTTKDGARFKPVIRLEQEIKSSHRGK